jgi:hypothetical protein
MRPATAHASQCGHIARKQRVCRGERLRPAVEDSAFGSVDRFGFNRRSSDADRAISRAWALKTVTKPRAAATAAASVPGTAASSRRPFSRRTFLSRRDSHNDSVRQRHRRQALVARPARTKRTRLALDPRPCVRAAISARRLKICPGCDVRAPSARQRRRAVVRAFIGRLKTSSSPRRPRKRRRRRRSSPRRSACRSA